MKEKCFPKVFNTCPIACDLIVSENIERTEEKKTEMKNTIRNEKLKKVANLKGKYRT